MLVVVFSHGTLSNKVIIGCFARSTMNGEWSFMPEASFDHSSIAVNVCPQVNPLSSLSNIMQCRSQALNF